MLVHQEVITRLAIAAVLGGIVGLQRERLEWVAGLHTHMLVCLGAALVMIVSAFGLSDVLGTSQVTLDPSRIAAQVVSGIGFLGAGTILFLRQEVIRGLTTAASLWTVAAVGLAVGSGLYLAAICTTMLVVVILALVKPLEVFLFRRNRSRQMVVRVDRNRTFLLQIESALGREGLGVREITLTRCDVPENDSVRFTFLRSVPKDVVLAAASRLQELDGVQGITLCVPPCFTAGCLPAYHCAASLSEKCRKRLRQSTRQLPPDSSGVAVFPGAKLPGGGRLACPACGAIMKSTENSSRRLFRLRKLPARYAGLVMPLFLSVFMTCIVSLISTLRSIGMVNGLMHIWMGAWGLSWVIAFPTLLFVLPLVKTVTGFVVEKP
jgi:putative Mg2+ transporter-C (MgtC) family protein